MGEIDDLYGADIPEGWIIWSEEDGVVICYKPDIFNGTNFPAVCIPTISMVESDREGWRVSFYIEADVEARRLGKEFRNYKEAVDYIMELAEEFNRGNFNLRDFYAKGDVREKYVSKLEKEIK